MPMTLEQDIIVMWITDADAKQRDRIAAIEVDHRIGAAPSGAGQHAGEAVDRRAAGEIEDVVGSDIGGKLSDRLTFVNGGAVT